MEKDNNTYIEELLSTQENKIKQVIEQNNEIAEEIQKEYQQ